MRYKYAVKIWVNPHGCVSKYVDVGIRNSIFNAYWLAFKLMAFEKESVVKIERIWA